MFGTLDWIIVAAYIGGTTLVGHHLKGKQHSTRDFFLGGRAMPWYAVTASTIATTISAVTFIGVPALVYASGGNYVYLQLALGGFIARYLVARFLVPLYYEKEFYSPYEYMEDRLGPVVGRITAGMFFLGGILGQGVRVYATALVLELITGWSLYESIVLIAMFSILWTWMGGIAAVIWTDFVQFFILVAGGIAALFFVTDALPEQLLRSEPSARWPALSPNGRWLAYVADERGTREVFVQPYAALDRRTKISSSASRSRAWSSRRWEDLSPSSGCDRYGRIRLILRSNGRSSALAKAVLNTRTTRFQPSRFSA